MPQSNTLLATLPLLDPAKTTERPTTTDPLPTSTYTACLPAYLPARLPAYLPSSPPHPPCQVLPVFLSALPVSEDFEEALPIFRALTGIVAGKHSHVLGMPGGAAP